MGQYRIPGDFIQDKPNPGGFPGGVVVGDCSGTGNSKGGGGGVGKAEGAIMSPYRRMEEDLSCGGLLSYE